MCDIGDCFGELYRSGFACIARAILFIANVYILYSLNFLYFAWAYESRLVTFYQGLVFQHFFESFESNSILH